MILPQHALRAEALIKAYAAKGFTVATAESCTGGLLAGCLTMVPGSSAVVDRGFVTYSNAAKTAMLGVSFSLLQQYGAVSRECAIAMAEGAKHASQTSTAISITGIAGPGGGSLQKPVGLVHFAYISNNRPIIHCEKRFGDLGRNEIRSAALDTCFDLLETIL